MSIDRSTCNGLLLLFFLIFFITGQGCIHEAAANNTTSDSWDRLLLEEIPLLKENIGSIINTLDNDNYTTVREKISDIESSDNWHNVRKELESRNQLDLISSFNNSVSRLGKLATIENSASIEQAQILLKDFQKNRTVVRPASY